MLLRDFAINFGVVADTATKFAEEMFHYEQRIINNIKEEKHSAILPLGEVQNMAPSVRNT